ncbi:hypothetical protein Tco_1253402 [Tanacetum coccineum]
MALVISTTEAEYVAARRACQQALWMKQAIKDHDIQCEDVLVLCDNKEQIDTEINSWFEQTMWDEAKREIRPDEVLGKEEEENYSQEHLEGDALDPWIPALEQGGATI